MTEAFQYLPQVRDRHADPSWRVCKSVFWKTVDPRYLGSQVKYISYQEILKSGYLAEKLPAHTAAKLEHQYYLKQV